VKRPNLSLVFFSCSSLLPLNRCSVAKPPFSARFFRGLLLGCRRIAPRRSRDKVAVHPLLGVEFFGRIPLFFCDFLFLKVLNPPSLEISSCHRRSVQTVGTFFGFSEWARLPPGLSPRPNFFGLLEVFLPHPRLPSDEPPSTPRRTSSLFLRFPRSPVGATVPEECQTPPP